MCGIFFLLKQKNLKIKYNIFEDYLWNKYKDYKYIIDFDKFIENKNLEYVDFKNIIGNLKKRGPDLINCYIAKNDISNINNFLKIEINELENLNLNKLIEESEDLCLIISSVLSLRIDNNKDITSQPFFDKNSILLFNGEIYSINFNFLKNNLDENDFIKLDFNKKCFDYKINDTNQLSKYLNIIVKEFKNDKLDFIMNIFIKSLNGDFSLIFINFLIQKIYISKDFWGKRSLLMSYNKSKNSLIFSSNNHLKNLKENDIQIKGENNIEKKYLECYNDSLLNNIFEVPKNKMICIKNFNKLMDLKNFEQIKYNNLDIDYKNLENFIDKILYKSTKDIIKNINKIENHSGISILFSGGLDCSLIVNYCLKFDKNLEIDLVNVSFNNNSPDRKFAIQSYIELQNLFPESKLNLVLVNKNYEDFENYKDNIKNLIYPCKNLIDLNIGSILFFGSKGIGINYNTNELFESKSKIYLSGLGADEIFGGYSRYRIANTRENTNDNSIRDEMDFDIDRWWIRNLGRDDRIISNNSKELRFPYLNTFLYNIIKNVNIKYLIDFNLNKGEGEKLILRKIALKNGLKSSSKFPKKAMQFGTGWAKIVNIKTYGSNRKGKAKNKI